MLLNRILRAEIEKIRQVDTGQETDITDLQTAVGTVPEESESLQEQVTALQTAVGTVPDDADSLQEQVTALELRVKTLEDA